MVGFSQTLWVELGEDNGGRFLALIEKRGERHRRIIIPEGKQANRWWRLMVVVSK